ERRRQDRVAWGGQGLGAVFAEPGDELRLWPVLAAQQQLGLDAQGGGDAVHPAEREIGRAGLEPADRLRRGRWAAPRGDFGRRRARLAAESADAVDHAGALGSGGNNQIGFILSYSLPDLASGSSLRNERNTDAADP